LASDKLNTGFISSSIVPNNYRKNLCRTFSLLLWFFDAISQSRHRFYFRFLGLKF